MSVRKYGKNYMVDVTDGRGQRIRKMVGSSKSVAELVEKDLRVKIAKQVHLGIYEAVTTTFKEYAEKWLERKGKKLSPSTVRDYRSTFEVYAFPRWGKIPMSRITPRDAEDLAENLGDPLRQAEEQHHGAGEKPLQRRQAPRGHQGQPHGAHPAVQGADAPGRPVLLPGDEAFSYPTSIRITSPTSPRHFSPGCGPTRCWR